MTEEKRTVVTSQNPVIFYDIFIAGPSDVRKERFYIRDKILLWTRDNAEATGIHLRPRMWELDSPGGTWPKDHEHPEKNSSQWIIDEKVVKRCDYLLAVFADKLGFQSEDKYPSGTAREIDIHASSGKPAKIFFCTSPYEGDDAEKQKERQRLDEYRQMIERQEFPWVAAYHPYTRNKFKARFNIQFNLLVKEIKIRAAQDVQPPEPVKIPLPKEINTLLLLAAEDPDQGFRILKTHDGAANYAIECNRQFFNYPPLPNSTSADRHKQDVYWRDTIIEPMCYRFRFFDLKTDNRETCFTRDLASLRQNYEDFRFDYEEYHLTQKGYEAIERLKKAIANGNNEPILYQVQEPRRRA